jgi:hypothetical protein
MLYFFGIFLTLSIALPAVAVVYARQITDGEGQWYKFQNKDTKDWRKKYLTSPGLLN